MTEQEVQLGELRRIVIATDGTKRVIQKTELPLEELEPLLRQTADDLRDYLQEQSIKEDTKDKRT